MQRQRTLRELKCLGDEAFAEAQATIDTARQLTRECRQMNAQLRQSVDEFKHAHKQSRDVLFYRRRD